MYANLQGNFSFNANIHYSWFFRFSSDHFLTNFKYWKIVVACVKNTVNYTCDSIFSNVTNSCDTDQSSMARPLPRPHSIKDHVQKIFCSLCVCLQRHHNRSAPLCHELMQRKSFIDVQATAGILMARCELPTHIFFFQAEIAHKYGKQ